MESIKIWGPPSAMLVLALGLAFCWNISHRARVSAEHDAEQARLALRQVVVATDETDKELRAGVEKLLAENELLKKAYEDAKRAAPGAAPKATAHLNTKSFEIKGLPEDSPVRAPAEQPAAKQTACVLRAGDLGSVEATVITLETRQQNLIIAGTAEFYRDAPPPRVKLGEGAFTASLSDVAALAPKAGPRWGGALLGLCTRDGCGLGGSVLLPPWSLWGLQVEAQAGALLGPVPAALGSLGVRW
jgi:hypothetical protein